MNKPDFIGKGFVCLIMTAVLLGMLGGSPLSAQAQSASTVSLNDPRELEAFLDPIFAAQMERLHIPGAVVVVVKDGRIFFTKGYGFANIERRAPVVPERTIFRIGSITKVFTATAVMQLADRGRINLNDDVNRYLRDISVPNTYPQPVTFAHLLTHTSGFDEINLGRRAPSADQVMPLSQFLRTRLIRRLPPGQLISYSTYGMTLAGHLVETISRRSLGDYFERNIFRPLRMNRSNLGAIPPARLRDFATGYEYAANGYSPVAFEFFHTYPASDINGTATDMARFMIAHLEGGRDGGRRILSERATRDMHRRHFTNHPRLPGWAYGFYESQRGHLRGLEHGGSMEGFSSLMYLLPEQRLGIYIACNTEAGGFGLSNEVKIRLLDRYFPARAAPNNAHSQPQPREALERFAGQYRWDVYCHSCPADARGFFPRPIAVTVNDDGTLSIFGVKWAQVEPLLFQLTDHPRAGQVFIAFREDQNRRITYMLHNTSAYERVTSEAP